MEEELFTTEKKELPKKIG